MVFEAYGGARHSLQVLLRLGHQARLIPPQYVKAFVKQARNDRYEAEVISEAACQSADTTN